MKSCPDLLFVKLSRSLQNSSNFWTSSGSCPLCLTPPCYNLEPPATAAPFYFSGSKLEAFPTVSASGNYVGNFRLKPAGQRPLVARCSMRCERKRRVSDKRSVEVSAVSFSERLAS